MRRRLNLQASMLHYLCNLNCTSRILQQTKHYEKQTFITVYAFDVVILVNVEN